MSKASPANGSTLRDRLDRGQKPPLPPDPVELIELLFFAYRDFTGDPDRILDQYGFGRAHHRVLHFVRRRPGLRVADLLAILKITKQSLGRVQRQLVEEGFIEQREGKDDRRERLLYVTAKGEALADRLMAPQIARIEAAARSMSQAADGGDSGTAAVRRFLLAMSDDPGDTDAGNSGAIPR